MDCLFCKIIAGEIPSKKVYEDEEVLAFCDIAPQAPVHIVLIPKTHLSSMRELTAENCGVVGRLFEAAARVAEEQGLAEGYRVVCNTGEDGGQTVPHLHFHLLGGRSMKWPPG